MKAEDYYKMVRGNQYVVIMISDGCDPTVYGLFSSEDKAEEFIQERYKNWEKYYSKNDTESYLQIEKLRLVK